MMHFKFSGINLRSDEPIKGVLKAESENDITKLLDQYSIQTIEIKQCSTLYVFYLYIMNFVIYRVLPLPKGELKEFNFLASSLLKSGFNLVETIEILQIACSARFKKILKDINEKISSGSDISNVFMQYNKIFPSYFSVFLKHSQSSSGLYQIFDSMQEISEIMDLKAILLVPRIPLLFIFSAILIGAVYFVSTEMSVMLTVAEYVDIQVHSSSYSLVATVLLITNYWYFVIAGVIAFVAALKFILKFDRARYAFDWACLHTPFLGKFLYARERTLFLKILSTALYNGIPVQNAIITIIPAIKNVIIKQQVIKMSNDLKSGETVGVALRSVKVFSKAFAQLLKIAAKGNEFADVVSRIYVYSKKDYNMRVMLLSQTIKILIYFLTIGLVFWLLAGAGLLYVSVLSKLFGN